VLLVSAVLAVPLAGQFQNPITAAKEAYKKAKEQQQQQQQRQQQQQQQQQQPAQQTPAAQPAAASVAASPAVPATEAAAPWTPPAETAAAAPIKLDPLKLPDVVGVHLGMTVAQALAITHKQYPSDIYSRFPVTWWPADQKPEEGSTVLSSAPGNEADVHLSFTAPPDLQLVWRLTRFTYRMNINHATLIAALRAKYGKETVATVENNGQIVTDDKLMSNLYWLYNESGERIPNPPPTAFEGGQNVANCWVIGNPQPLMPYKTEQVKTFHDWCTRLVGLRVSITPQEIVQQTFTELIDIPLALRHARASQAWLDKVAEEQRKEQIERSKAVAPVL
jgi:hypothetical protein